MVKKKSTEEKMIQLIEETKLIIFGHFQHYHKRMVELEEQYLIENEKKNK
jgi:hypothetical protein